MTEEQFEKGADILQSIRGLRYLVDGLVKDKEPIIRPRIDIPHFVDDDIVNKIQEINIKHSDSLKAEILRCLYSHLDDLKSQLEKI